VPRKVPDGGYISPDDDIEVSVPLFCDIGTRIKLDTRDGSFVERAK